MHDDNFLEGDPLARPDVRIANGISTTLPETQELEEVRRSNPVTWNDLMNLPQTERHTAIERGNLNLPASESTIMLVELQSSLRPLIAEARVKGNDDELNFYERNIYTRVSEKLYRLLQPDDDRPPVYIPFIKDSRESKAFNKAWKGVKFDYASGKFASQGEFEDAMQSLYKNYWEGKNIVENNPAEIK